MTEDNDKPPESHWKQYGLPCLGFGGFGLFCFYLAYVFIHDCKESDLAPPQLMALTAIFVVFGEKYRPILSAIVLGLLGLLFLTMSGYGIRQMLRDRKTKK